MNFTADTETLSISCRCKVCKANAAILGVALPLKATVSTPQGRALASRLGGRHALVYAAHGRTCIEQDIRTRYAVQPA